jgi:hypothetical protein
MDFLVAVISELYTMPRFALSASRRVFGMIFSLSFNLTIISVTVMLLMSILQGFPYDSK